MKTEFSLENAIHDILVAASYDCNFSRDLNEKESWEKRPLGVGDTMYEYSDTITPQEVRKFEKSLKNSAKEFEKIGERAMVTWEKRRAGFTSHIITKDGSVVLNFSNIVAGFNDKNYKVTMRAGAGTINFDEVFD